METGHRPCRRLPHASGRCCESAMPAGRVGVGVTLLPSTKGQWMGQQGRGTTRRPAARGVQHRRRRLAPHRLVDLVWCDAGGRGGRGGKAAATVAGPPGGGRRAGGGRYRPSASSASRHVGKRALVRATLARARTPRRWSLAVPTGPARWSFGRACLSVRKKAIF